MNNKIEMTYDSLVEFWGQIPELDHSIALIGEMEAQEDGNTSLSAGSIGVDITDRSVALVQLDEDQEPLIGELKMFKGNEAYRISLYLEAYLITNREVLEHETITELEQLIQVMRY